MQVMRRWWWRLKWMRRRIVAPALHERSAADHLEAGLTPGWGAKTDLQRSLLTSLDQLFVQAACLEPILLLKVREWALSSGGCFPCRLSPVCVTYVRWPGEGAEAPGEFKWCALKSAQRAIEKVIRSYGQDASRLVDVCRQSIVFEDMRGVAACLGAIAADPDVALLRVKNRLDPAHDAIPSGGYRDVNLNLRFTTASAALLGVEAHVCEVQLVLLRIAELKREDGHARYVTGRNLRAE